ncbi:MAG TPA: sigma-54 dependent transcriptional regulator [Vicinamibacterales bacterium]|jgi:DNA-binding NtrC family response regulator
MDSPTGILVIDDDTSVQRSLTSALSSAYAVHVASTGEEGLQAYERIVPDVVLLDVMLPQMSGLAVLRTLKRMSAELPIIMMTAYAEVQTAVQAIKLGATDYLQKPIDCATVRKEIEQLVIRGAQRRSTARASIVGRSAAIRRVWRLVESFGPTDIPILLQGETGTGKGLFAEAIHRLSKRADNPFVAIDCATIPEQLAESELFGYEDGAFTGAGKKKRGRVAFADHGTLFLDEIGTLSAATQAKLLTVVEQQHFLPLGARSLQPTHIDVRFISATNVPLQRAAEEGSFRSDLFHRLNGVTIELPPLRDREGDIELLARHLVATLGKRLGKQDLDISRGALDRIQEYTWPGNVRELQRVLSAAVVLADSEVSVDDLPEYMRDVPSTRSATEASDLPINLREIKEWAGREAQKRVIVELQKSTNMSRQELARLLGVDPKTLRSRLKEMTAGLPRAR